MAALFDVRDVDRCCYRDRLAAFLPDKIIDVHTHVWLHRFRAAEGKAAGRIVTWPDRVARQNPPEDLAETYALMFPGKRVVPLIFGMSLAPGDDLEGGNAYASASAAASGWPALIFSVPQWSARELESRVIAGGFLGAKVYLTWSDPAIPADRIRVFDYLPHHQLEVLDRHGWVAMLHIPRSARLKDPVNVSDLIEIDRRYPNVRLIVAHIGRAYCVEDVGDALDQLAATEHLVFDISANTNAEVFEHALRAVGPDRIVFGSDLPITRMRMRRLCEGGIYVNLVPQGMYGDVSGDRNLREISGEEADRLTFFLYEEIDAFRRASEAAGLTRSDVDDVFFNNARRILTGAGAPASLFD